MKLEYKHTEYLLLDSLNIISKTLVLYFCFLLLFFGASDKTLNTRYCILNFFLFLHQLNPGSVYENISTQGTEQTDHHYGKRSSRYSPRPETSDNMEEVNKMI